MAFAALLLLVALPGFAQPVSWDNPEAETLYNEARGHLSAGRYQAAVQSYQALLPLSGGRVIVKRELAQAYSLSGNDKRALSLLEPLVEGGRADEGVYQLTSDIYVRQGETKKSTRVLKQGLKSFPSSGMLYHALGKAAEESQNVDDAAEAYVAGIRVAPTYHVNYYDAARVYFRSNRLVWAMLYAEIFINMERETPRSYDARRLLFGAYRRFYLGDPKTTGANMILDGSSHTPQRDASFEDAVTTTYQGVHHLISDGFDVENLTMLRVRFLANWQSTYGNQHTFHLFNHWSILLKQGHFDAYNQWLFGKAASEPAFKSWTDFNGTALSGLQAFLVENQFKPSGTDAQNTEKGVKFMPVGAK